MVALANKVLGWKPDYTIWGSPMVTTSETFKGFSEALQDKDTGPPLAMSEMKDFLGG